jgi:hypothetical protein
VLTLPIPQPFVPLFQLGDTLNALAPHNVLASIMTGGQYHAPIYSKETVAEFYNPTQLTNQIPGVTFSYLKTEPYGQMGYQEPESDVKFWVYNNSNESKHLRIEVNQLLCMKVSTGGNFPCQYEAGSYPLVYSTDITLAPGGAREIKFKMFTPPVSSKPGFPQQVGDVERVRVEVNVTDDQGHKAKLAAMAVPK